MAARRSIIMAIAYSIAIISIVLIFAFILIGGGRGIIYP